MKVLVLIILLLFPLYSFCQESKLYYYKVHYHSFQEIVIDSNVQKSMNVKILADNETKKIFTQDSFPLSIITPKFNFEASYYILSDKNQSKTIFVDEGEKQSTNIQVEVTTPDTLFYKEGKWAKESNHIMESLPSKKLSVIPTNIYKKILGYLCRKYICTDIIDKKKYFIWATQRLPKTLLPFVGLEKFNAGILEISAGDKSWHTKAEKIVIIKKTL